MEKFGKYNELLNTLFDLWEKSYDENDRENPWRILGANCSWYFATREAAEEWYLAERAPRRRGRRGKWS